MLLEVQSPVLAPTGRRMIVMLGVFSMWSWFASPHSMAQPPPNAGGQGREEVFRFEVSDGENNRPLPNASVRIILWRHESGSQQKKEMEARTDESGVAVFPKVQQTEKLAVSVEAQGYRSTSRWIDPKDFGHAIRIRLEKWRRVPK